MGNNIERKLEIAARDVTDEEVAFYEEHGWVKLDGFIAPEIAAELLAAGQRLKETVRSIIEKQAPERIGKHQTIYTPEWMGVWTTDDEGELTSFQARKIRIDPFYSFTFNKSIGRSVQRLMNRASLTDEPVGVRYVEDALLYLEPTNAAVESAEAITSSFHQDNFNVDRSGGFNLWIALDEVEPVQAMSFLDKSNTAGPLGSGAGPVLERYPKLVEKYEWAPPLHYKPGDATVHHELIIHGGARRCPRARWSYVPSYMPADCIPRKENTGFGYREPNEPFPVVYP